MKLDMFWTKLVSLIIFVINVKAVEKLEENSGLSESTWFKNWRRPTTTPGVLENLFHSLADKGQNPLVTTKSFVGFVRPEFEYDSLPKTAQVSTIINEESAQSNQAVLPRMLQETISYDKKDKTLNITSTQTANIEKDVKSEPTSDKPEIQPISYEEPIREVLSYTKLEQLSEPLSYRYANYNPVENVGVSSSLPEFVPYSLSTSKQFEFKCSERNGYYGIANECDKFVECKEFVPKLYKCSHDLQFNSNAVWPSHPCGLPSTVNCKSNHILFPTDQPSSKPMLLSSHSKAKFSAVLITSRVMDYICPLSDGYYKLDKSCEKFIKCEQKIASLYKCKSGLHFRSKAGANENPCAIPSVAQCEKEVKTRPKSSALLVDPNLEDYRCSEASGYFGIDNSCERFIECQHFVPSLYMCPNSLLFNRQAAWGEDPCSSSVHCELKSTARTALVEEPGPKKSYTIMMNQVPGYLCSVENGYFSVEDKCDHFIMCKQNVATLNICNIGLHFNRNAAWEADPCSEPWVALCERSNSLQKPSMPSEIEITDGPCPRSRGYLFLPLDNTECSKYIRCEYGRATIMPCPPGLVFNTELEACDWPANVPSCNPEVFHGFICPSPKVNEDGTPSDDIMKFRYGQSCKQFIACQAERPRLLSCDLGLSFSHESQSCILSDSVSDCKD